MTRRRNRKKHPVRKRHNASDFMPAIQPNPTLNEDNIEKLPKISMDCAVELDDGDIDKIKIRLNFADHKDLGKLNGIRVVDPGTIKIPSGESTTGCYHPGDKSGGTEIWLSSQLIKPPKGFEALLSRIACRDPLFETLFHEIGHHKARLTHSVDKFENEAYAERYMLAYRKLWKKHYGPPKIYVTVLRFVLNCIRFILMGILFPFKNKNEEIGLFYRNLKGEITFEECLDGMMKHANAAENGTGKRRRKWTHPLNRKKYRDRFNIPER
jgi:hypothetical protein